MSGSGRFKPSSSESSRSQDMKKLFLAASALIPANSWELKPGFYIRSYAARKRRLSFALLDGHVQYSFSLPGHRRK
jgi:hypothetical protein